MNNCSQDCRITDTDRRDLALITFYEDGHSKEETAEEFGLSLSYTKALIRIIVKVQRPLEIQRRAWFEAQQSGMTIEEIAERDGAFALNVARQIKAYYPLYY